MSKETLPEQIAHRLRRAILRGELPLGSPVKERDIAAEMGVSRTPIREAVRILSKEGLVDLRPSRSPLIAQPDVSEIADQTTVLIALEKLSAELACAKASESQIADIEAILARMDRDFDTADPLDMFEIDMSFHTAIAWASGNAALAETHGTFLRRLWRARYLAALKRRNRVRVIGQHAAIVRGLRARDPVAVRAAIDAHLSNMAEDIRAVIEQETNDPTDMRTPS